MLLPWKWGWKNGSGNFYCIRTLITVFYFVLTRFLWKYQNGLQIFHCFSWAQYRIIFVTFQMQLVHCSLWGRQLWGFFKSLLARTVDFGTVNICDQEFTGLGELSGDNVVGEVLKIFCNCRNNVEITEHRVSFWSILLSWFGDWSKRTKTAGRTERRFPHKSP